MSWSFQAVGTPKAVAHAIETGSNNTMGEPSLSEWLEAKPALLALVGANVGNVAVEVNANGHAQFGPKDNPAGVGASVPVKLSGICAVTIRPLYGFVVVENQTPSE